MSTTASFAAVFAALYAAHQIGDHWVQTENQAHNKTFVRSPGRLYCTLHVVTYTLTALIAVLTVVVVTDLTVTPLALIVGLSVSAITHWIADRRTWLQLLAERTGHARFYRLGTPRTGRDDNPCLGTGAYALDQSWHIGWLFIAALIIA